MGAREIYEMQMLLANDKNIEMPCKYGLKNVTSVEAGRRMNKLVELEEAATLRLAAFKKADADQAWTDHQRDF